ncbi:MAG: hypothetical protein FJW38_19055 [Acidobacteria bacterium]|nr:hypothetical protein [Acidobacteriota bacterium]
MAINRRRLLTSLARGAAAASLGVSTAFPFAKLKVTEIEIHPIMVECEDWIAYQLNHYYGPSRRVV